MRPLMPIEQQVIAVVGVTLSMLALAFFVGLFFIKLAQFWNWYEAWREERKIRLARRMTYFRR